MPIVSTDILVKLSTTSGTAGNQNSQANPNQSLGKYISTSTIPSGSLNNLFDNISGAENAASTIDYRCIFIHNSHGSLTLQSPVIWISAEVAGGANVAIGVDPATASPIGQSSSQAAVVADELTAPPGVTFSAPVSKATGVNLDDLGPNQCRAVWVRRSATNSSALSNDGATLRVEGDTAA